MTVDRAATRERLRRLIKEIEGRPPHRAGQEQAQRVPSVAGFGPDWRELDGVLVRDRVVEPLDRHGHQTFEALRLVDGALLAFLSGDATLKAATLDDLRFIDIEATGLGGAGAMVFLVGIGRWVDGRFVLRQYLAPSPPAEGALLRHLIEHCLGDAHDPVLVTYNGATYDAPMLDARATMHRLRGGFGAASHLDLLKTVRRGLSDAVRPHRLAHIESLLLGVSRNEADVSGADVPAWYFRFLHSGDPRMLRGIIQHNADDVLSLAALICRFATLRRAAVPPTAWEHLMLGRLFARQGDSHGAVRHLSEARQGMASIVTSHLVAMETARLLRRSGCRDDASVLWAEVAAGQVAPVEALIELAKDREHRLRDYDAALRAVHQAILIRGPTTSLSHRHDRLIRRGGKATERSCCAERVVSPA